MIGFLISSISKKYHGQRVSSGMCGRAMEGCPRNAAWLDTNSPVEQLRSHAPGDAPVDG
jgi:hypothetical protein